MWRWSITIRRAGGMDDAKAKINVSVAVITKNEERLIGRCLDSVQWSDDIIVVDGMSADRTAEIARSKGARVAEHKFTGSFADDRNLVTEMARNEWVLHIDADDVVTEGFRRRMAEALAKGGKVDVYKFRRRNSSSAIRWTTAGSTTTYRTSSGRARSDTRAPCTRCRYIAAPRGPSRPISTTIRSIRYSSS